MKSVMVNNVASSYKNYDTLMNDSRSLGVSRMLKLYSVQIQNLEIFIRL